MKQELGIKRIFEVFNNYDYQLNSTNGTPILQVETLDDERFQNLIENKDKVFSRVGDNKFKIFKDSYGYLKYKIENSTNDSIRPLPIFNYMQDKWVMINE